MRATRVRTFGLVAVVAVALGLVAMQPTEATYNTDVVRLRLSSSGDYFAWGSSTQQLKTGKNVCDITSAEPLIDLSSAGTGTTPGLVDDGIGVRQPGGSNGTPCSQVDSIETLRLTRGSSLGSRLFESVRLDLEMTGNALVLLTFTSNTQTATYRLQTGTSITSDQSGESGYDRSAPYQVTSGPGDEIDACAAPNSSGPNSGSNDNCQWRVTPGFDFHTISLATTRGTVSLEGGGDFGSNVSNNETLLYLADAPPNAVNDTVTTAEDTPRSGNVLTNDSDPEGKPLTAALVTPPAHGSVTLASNGAFTYTPAANYNGPDSFVYAASDGERATNATVSITVTPGNDAPVAFGDTAEVNEGSSVAIDVVDNDVDIDGDALSPTGIAAIAPTGATAVAQPDGTVLYTPPAGYSGPGSFTYRATDGTATSAPATVTIDVVPVICSNDTVTTEDGNIIGSFTRLDDVFECKRYTLDSDDVANSIIFVPVGGVDVNYRGFLTFDPEPPPGSDPGSVTLQLRYDPTGGTTFRPVLWCIDPVFDEDGNVEFATNPPGDTWCIASADTRATSGGIVTTFQVFGISDPRFAR